MKRYVIMAKENYPGATIKEICRCNSNPNDIRNALADYTVTGALGGTIFKYNHVEILDISKKQVGAQMKKPDRNIMRLLPDKTANQLLAVLQQVDAMRAGDGEREAAPRATSEERPTLPQRQSEAEP